MQSCALQARRPGGVLAGEGRKFKMRVFEHCAPQRAACWGAGLQVRNGCRAACLLSRKQHKLWGCAVHEAVASCPARGALAGCAGHDAFMVHRQHGISRSLLPLPRDTEGYLHMRSGFAGAAGGRHLPWHAHQFADRLSTRAVLLLRRRSCTRKTWLSRSRPLA